MVGKGEAWGAYLYDSLLFSPFQFLVYILNLLGMGPCVKPINVQPLEGFSTVREKGCGEAGCGIQQMFGFLGSCVTFRIHLSCSFLICHF